MTGAEVDALRARITSALKDAMRARAPVTVSALRALLHALDNASAVDTSAQTADQRGVGSATEVPRRIPTRAEVESLFRTEVDEREQAARTYDDVAEPAIALRLRAEADVVRTWVAALVSARAQ